MTTRQLLLNKLEAISKDLKSLMDSANYLSKSTNEMQRELSYEIAICVTKITGEQNKVLAELLKLEKQETTPADGFGALAE